MKLQINPEYEKLVPELSKQDYEELKKSIQEDGLYYPIIVNQDEYVLDGHHRRKAWIDIGKEEDKLPTKTRKYEDKLEEKKFVITSNLKRRHLQIHERLALVEELHKIEAEQAKQKQKEAGKEGRKHGLVYNDLQPFPNWLGSPQKRKDTRKNRPKKPKKERKKGESRTRAAKVQNVSDESLRRWEYVKEHGSEKIKEGMTKGWISPTRAFKIIKSEELSKTLTSSELPTEQFDIILADPPWKYDITLRGTADNQYETMEESSIADMNIPSANNCVLFLWATQTLIKTALNVMEKWGFEYRTGAVWIKDSIGPGYYFRLRHELLLIGIKGDIPAPLPENRPDSVIEAPRQQHSKKPDRVYELIEQMYPNRKYLELFARQTRKGWTSWGKELK